MDRERDVSRTLLPIEDQRLHHKESSTMAESRDEIVLYGLFNG